MTEASDQALVEAARKGDPAAFEALYHRHESWVTGLAFRFCRNREDALDVLQETFSYLLRRLPTLELRCTLKTFLYPAVKHLALSRKEITRRHLPLSLDADPPGRAGRKEEMDDLLRHLSEAQRETVLMRFVDGMDLKDIAEALKIPLGTVKSRLHTALETLRGNIFPPQ